MMWLRERRQALPEPWPVDGHRRVAADGSEHLTFFRTIALDPFEQSHTRQVRLEKWNAGSLVVAEEYTLRQQMYFRNELLLLLQIAGFREMEVWGDYTEEPATAEHSQLVFVAVR